MKKEDLGHEFQRRASKYSNLEEEVKFILKGIHEKTNIKLHSITSKNQNVGIFFGQSSA